MSSTAPAPSASPVPLSGAAAPPPGPDMQSVLSFVVLGGSGALAKKETYPALFGLWKQGHLPPKTHIVSYARSKNTLDSFRAQVRAGLPSWATSDDKDRFSALMYYERYEKIDKDVADLDKRLTELEDRAIASTDEGRDASSQDASSVATSAPKLACNRVLYLAVPPENFVELATGLRKGGPEGQGAMSKRGWTRLLVEKPIGRDSNSAQKVNEELGALFEEQDIYRVDHFLGYPMVQQLPSLRADNPTLFGEHAFSAQTVQAVEITLHEEFGVSGRGGYFDSHGIIRDVISNHLLQVLVTLLMELPSKPEGKGVQGPDADEEAWRSAKVALLKQFQPVQRSEAVVGQYTHATSKAPAYLEEQDIPKDSVTPTFASMVLRLQGNKRWEGVPFILRAGKGVHVSKGEVRVLYKPAAQPLAHAQQPNELRLDINTDGKVELRAHSVQPAMTGSGLRKLQLVSEPDAAAKREKAYQRVFVDCLRGAHAHFYRRDELQACWKIFDDLLHGLEENKQKPLPYLRGSRGPEAADELARKVGFVRPEEAEEQAHNLRIDRHQYDLLVIGGGSGGFGCARRAAKYGASVLLIEGKNLGGTCVNLGCIPKKLFWNAASILETLEVAPSYGIEVAAAGSGGLLHGSSRRPRVDWAQFKQARDEHIASLRDSYENNAHEDDVKVARGQAKFISSTQVQVTDKDGKETTYSAKHIVIAVGSEASMDVESTGIVGASEHAISSDGFFSLEELPRKVAVIGGGYIAVELAQVMATFGAEVHHFFRQDRALKKFDSMLSETLRETHREAGIQQYAHTRISEISKDSSSGQRRVSYRQSAVAGGPMESKQADGFDVVLVAAGRKPRITGLGLDKAGVKTQANAKTGAHFIGVDEQQNTNVPGIYALGDVVSKVDLTPVAIAAGRALAERLFHDKPASKLSYDAVPSVIFSHPPIGTVGLSEREAVQQQGEKQVTVYEAEFTDLFFSLRGTKSAQERAEKDKDKEHALHVPTKTKVKLVCVGASERVAGVHVIGRGADEMLQGFAVAVKAGLSKEQFDQCVAIHPTAAEEVVTLKTARPGRKD